MLLVYQDLVLYKSAQYTLEQLVELIQLRPELFLDS
jgi:hypothetical protein